MDNVIQMGSAQRIERLGLIEKEQLAAQVVAILDAHFKRPDADEKKEILKAACLQVDARRLP